MKISTQKVLIVDDNPKNVQLLAKLLSDNGYTIETAMSGVEALELVEEDEFDLILLDIMMPVMDGFEVCDKIKQKETNKDLPIIFLTAKTDIESISMAFSKGGWDYLTNPFNTEELLARVHTQIELKKSKDQLKEVNQWLEEKVTERTAELKVANEKLLNLDNAKTEFLKIISHEIRTPLNGIIGGLSLLKEVESTKEIVEFIDILDESAKRLESFSYKALDISQLNVNGIIVREKTDIAQTVSSVIDELNDIRESKEIEISQTISMSTFDVDPNYFHKCLYNIIHNAMIYSPDKGSILINVSDHDDKMVFEIKDEGIGFKDSLVINEIGPFDSEEHVDKNPGLGLFLSNLIVVAHGGKIENGNNEKKGAFVKLIIPNN